MVDIIEEDERTGSNKRMVNRRSNVIYPEVIMGHFQLLATIIACMPSLSGGLTYGFSAILIPQLQDPESDIQITLEQGSWIGESLPSFLRENDKVRTHKLRQAL